MSPHHEIVCDPETLAALVPAWRELWRRTKATPFQSPDWLTPWWDIFAPGELRIITVRDGGSLVGLAPLYREQGRYGSRLLPVGISVSDYVDVLVDPECPDAVGQLAPAIAEMDDIDEVELGELRPRSEAMDIPVPSGWQRMATAGSVCPVLALPETVEALRSAIPRSRLRHLRTARNRAARRGDVVIIEGDVDNAEALLSDLVRLHTARWSGQGQGGVFADPRVPQFHAAALPHLMKEGLVRLYGLSINDLMAGGYYGFQHRENAYAYLCGYDPDFAFESPGAILLGHAIEQAVREGATEFHFLRGEEAYKYEWGAKDRMNTRLVFAREQRRRAHG